MRIGVLGRALVLVHLREELPGLLALPLHSPFLRDSRRLAPPLADGPDQRGRRILGAAVRQPLQLALTFLRIRTHQVGGDPLCDAHLRQAGQQAGVHGGYGFGRRVRWRCRYTRHRGPPWTFGPVAAPGARSVRRRGLIGPAALEGLEVQPARVMYRTLAHPPPQPIQGALQVSGLCRAFPGGLPYLLRGEVAAAGDGRVPTADGIQVESARPLLR